MNSVWLRYFMRQLSDRVVIGWCTIGPVGNWGKAPGTLGSVVGIALYTLIFIALPLWGQGLLALLCIGFAVLMCDEGERRMQQRDPGRMILDEVVAMPVCFIGLLGLMQQTGVVWLFILLGFGIFRFFDILKPLGINRLQKYPGGWGVVLDDVAAAIATNICLQVLARLWLWQFPAG